MKRLSEIILFVALTMFAIGQVSGQNASSASSDDQAVKQAIAATQN
jgi:hypothetical protein